MVMMRIHLLLIGTVISLCLLGCQATGSGKTERNTKQTEQKVLNDTIKNYVVFKAKFRLQVSPLNLNDKAAIMLYHRQHDDQLLPLDENDLKYFMYPAYGDEIFVYTEVPQKAYPICRFELDKNSKFDVFVVAHFGKSGYDASSAYEYKFAIYTFSKTGQFLSKQELAHLIEHQKYSEAEQGTLKTSDRFPIRGSISKSLNIRLKTYENPISTKLIDVSYRLTNKGEIVKVKE
jgi:hypothetical protein